MGVEVVVGMTVGMPDVEISVVQIVVVYVCFCA